MSAPAGAAARSGSAPSHTSTTTPSLEVVCEGSSYEMGLAQGSALREKIAGTLRSLPALEALQLEKPSWLPFRAFRLVAERKVGRLWAPLRGQHPAEFERLDGLAAGSGAEPRTLWFMNALEPLIASLDGKTVKPPGTIKPPLGACCAVAVRGSRSIGSHATLRDIHDGQSDRQR